MVLKHNVVNLEKVKNNKKFQGRLRKKCEGVNFLFFTAESLYSQSIVGHMEGKEEKHNKEISNNKVAESKF